MFLRFTEVKLTLLGLGGEEETVEKETEKAEKHSFLSLYFLLDHDILEGVWQVYFLSCCETLYLTSTCSVRCSCIRHHEI